MGSLFGKKTPPPDERLRERYPIQTQTVVQRLILSVPPDGRPKGGQRPKTSTAVQLDLYKDGEFGFVTATTMPGCFAFRPMSSGLLLAHHNWLSKNLYSVKYTRDGLEQPVDLETPGFVVSQIELEDGAGVLHLANQGLRKYQVSAGTITIDDEGSECLGRSDLSYDKASDRLWSAAGTLNMMSGISKGLTALQEVLPDHAYDSVFLTEDGKTLFTKNRIRNKQFKMVVTIEVYEVSEDGELAPKFTLEDLPNPRVFCIDPKGQFLFTGGFGDDPTARCYKVGDDTAELVSEVNVKQQREGLPFERLSYHRGLLKALTEDRLITFRVAKDGKLTKAAELEQCCLSFLEPIEYP